MTSHSSSCHYSVIIPAFNEEGGIGGVLEEIGETLGADRDGVEIIVVDDGSTDGTATEAEKHGAQVVRHPVNMGYGAAILTGIRAARHPNVVTMDADRTYAARDIPSLVKELDKFDLVIGMRRGTHYKGPLPKRIARATYSWLVAYVTGTKLPDANSGLRAFRRDVALRFFDAYSRGFSFSTTMSMVFLLNGHFVTSIPIEYRQRAGKTKVRFVRDTLRTVQLLTSMVMVYNPIKAFLPLVLLVGLAGVVLLLAGVAGGGPWVLLMGVLALLFSLHLGSLALISDLISRAVRSLRPRDPPS